MRFLRCLLVPLVFAASVSPACAAEPVDKNLIPEARKVLDYLHSIYGKKVLVGQEKLSKMPKALDATGRMPALASHDLCGWAPKKWSDLYTRHMESKVEKVKAWWHEKGGIMSMQWHWADPAGDRGSGCRSKEVELDVGKVVTPGTAEHKAVMEDLRRHADYLEQLAEAKVPILWRPLHEIDGGWFWWTDTKKPENTAALWRMMFDYFIKERDLHNLIWVYSAALKAGPKGKDDLAAVDYRRRFYPGAEYVDIAGIDIYPNDWFGWGPYQETAYPKAMAFMKKVAPGKILALCECRGVPAPDVMATQGPRWLYVLPWDIGGGDWNPPTWIRKTYPHEVLVTLDELPPLVPHNLPPLGRITAPADGAELPAGRTVEVAVEAGDRGGNVAAVEVRALAGPWDNWFDARHRKLPDLLEQSEVVGKATDAPYTVTWNRPPAGFHNLVAVVTDNEGATAATNVVRVTVGLEDLACGRKAEASSHKDAAGKAVDGDPWTAWSGEKKGAQWLSVDLGGERTVGAVMLLWGGTYAEAYTVQVACEPGTWTDVHAETAGDGDADVIRFDPLKARRVRLRCTKRGTNWGGYTLSAFRVYAERPG